MNFHFLFREDKGKIDRATWWKAVAGLAGIWLAALLLYQYFGHFSLGDASQLVLHDAEGHAEKLHKLGDGSILIFPATVLTVVSFMVGVCYYFVSAKRFQDIDKSGALALVLPLIILLTAAMHWMQPQLGGNNLRWLVYVFDGALSGSVVVNIWVLGFRDKA